MVDQLGKIEGYVTDVGTGAATRKKESAQTQTNNPVFDAEVEVYPKDTKDIKGKSPLITALTNDKGYFVTKDIPADDYLIVCRAFRSDAKPEPVEVEPGYTTRHDLNIPVGLRLTCLAAKPEDDRFVEREQVTAGTPVTLRAEYASGGKDTVLEWGLPDQGALYPGDSDNERVLYTDRALGRVNVRVTLKEVGSPGIIAGAAVNVLPAVAQPPISGQIGVTLQRSGVAPTLDIGLWAAIRNHAKTLSFGGIGATVTGYQGFINKVLCGDGRGIVGGPTEQCGPLPDLPELSSRVKGLPLHGMAAWDLLKTATEVFLLWHCGVAIREKDAFGNQIINDDEEFARSGLRVGEVTSRLTQYLGPGRLPYIDRVVRTVFPGQIPATSVFCTGLTPRADCACLIELIWSYWHEEGMLAQTLNAISRRFQNLRGAGERDPLAHLEIDPLRPLNSLLWGYIQDEQNRLTVKRRAYEYDHHYGLTMYGKAVPLLRPADSRSKFLEAFHHLLHRTSIFYKEDNDTTVIADGFPLLNALKEVHLLLAQGAHNQFGDLPWAARVEMLAQQWLLARPEMREFLQSRPMVPYTEAWMPQVDTMKTLQGWSDVTITHFRDLGVYGEQILLSIRYGDWIDVNDENSAKNWARYWRPEIQGYLHAYRAVTGVDLTNPDTVDFTKPAVHLQKRLAMQRAR